jgi:predicted N-formylglutamate amidohydrolase
VDLSGLSGEKVTLLDDAYEIAGDPRAGPFLFTCEHATWRLPEWEPSAADLPYLHDHWGWDVGAADLTRELARLSGCGALLSRFSRLVCDPNRDPGEPTFVVREVAGHVLTWNRAVDGAERTRRRARYFDPYHAAIDRALAQRAAAGAAGRLCSIHSFTPTWDGRARPMEVGVLFDAHEELARRVAAALAREGFAVAENEPYSGMAGLIYAAQRHGRAHGVVYLELEVRNDLIATADRARAIAPRIARALEAYAEKR